MKRIVLIVSALMLVAACQRQTEIPEAVSEAYKIYQEYAGREDLMVAMVGDFVKDSSSFNAVMLRAQNSIVWQRLMEEFDMSAYYERMHGKTERGMVMSEEVFCLKCTCEYAKDFVDRKADSLWQNAVGGGFDAQGRQIHNSSATDFTGYVKVIDESSLSLWLFVFCDNGQLHAIIDHIFSRAVPACICGDNSNR